VFIENSKTGEKLKAGVIPCTIEELRQLDGNRFEFDWLTESSFMVFRLEILSSNEILGLMSIDLIPVELRLEIRLLELSKENVGRQRRFENVAGILIASACKISFKMGFFGFVSLIPKTRLITHYQTRYGFEQYGRHLAVDMEKSQLLIKKYLEDAK
jgi:hypothetical protein